MSLKHLNIENLHFISTCIPGISRCGPEAIVVVAIVVVLDRGVEPVAVAHRQLLVVVIAHEPVVGAVLESIVVVVEPVVVLEVVVVVEPVVVVVLEVVIVLELLLLSSLA